MSIFHFKYSISAIYGANMSKLHDAADIQIAYFT